MNEIVYFELNNWFPGRDYPDEKPFWDWINNHNHRDVFEDDDWCRRNQICVVQSVVDMSFNYCITATKSWVETNCPRILTEHKKFLRFPDEDGNVYGQFGCPFNEWCEENFRCEYNERDDWY